MQSGFDLDSSDVAHEKLKRVTITGVVGKALSMLFRARQLPEYVRNSQIFGQLEICLEKERDQLPLWVPVGLSTGIASWFLMADSHLWIAFIAFCLGLAVFVKLMGQGTRIGSAIFWFLLFLGAGCAIMWIRSVSVAAPVLERPTVATFYGEIEKTEIVSARDIFRLTLDTHEKQGLPPRVRLNVPIDKATDDLKAGAVVQLRARLMPPAMASLPGAYDFSRRAWFMGLGATGQALGDIKVIEPAKPKWGPMALLPDYRQRLSNHVQSQMDGGAGAIGATLATGDRGAISDEDAEAMRRSGLAHLLSISGLHVTAIVGAVYLLVMRVLALFPALALRFRLPLIAASCAAAAALAYTLLTGAQVPTIRACIAALLILTALIIGRSAITLRMVAAGALLVLIIWPESLVGPSFQLSFAAVTAIIALHTHPRIQSLFSRRDEAVLKRFGRAILALFLTGLVVELALMPIALFHFHKAGIYGALANIIAIPLTTFFIMPLEALALLLDIVGLGAPVWWVCEKALNGLLVLAHYVSGSPGSVTMLPTMPLAAFGLLIFGGLWLALWTQRWRAWGLLPVCCGTLIILTDRPPDIYITSDGRHVGIRNQSGELAMLRTSKGGFAYDMLLENAGIDGDAIALENWPNAQCNVDSCTVIVEASDRNWTMVTTRSSYYIPALALSAACSRADIVVSERRLPASCQPRWFKADRTLLQQVGGMTIDLESQQVKTTLSDTGRQAWTRFSDPEKRPNAEKAGKNLIITPQ
ncbi:ComEC/Rec2 family competence protein [Parasphingorhabdus cellanae]|uniref:ComEC/Rec2 family competence protein n=1 Tax=Parasphingorhabdus cellanae TaxID=2806553 RepID=A0ABX7T4L9_9SPHN|nr:ComEC/Rec2 family competence protein [Parasphingorhabdus cellanae]QTD56081.1 ComEC/Rec2 family competence protein [Parasphingorhabdus cellanae]